MDSLDSCILFDLLLLAVCGLSSQRSPAPHRALALEPDAVPFSLNLNLNPNMVPSLNLWDCVIEMAEELRFCGLRSASLDGKIRTS